MTVFAEAAVVLKMDRQGLLSDTAWARNHIRTFVQNVQQDLNRGFRVPRLRVDIDQEHLGRGLTQARGQYQGFFSDVARIGAGILAAVGIRSLVAGVKDLGAGFISTNARLEQYNISFAVLLKDARAASRLIREIEVFAAKTPFSTSSLVQSVQLLKAYGFETERLLPMMKTIGDAAAASPMGMEFGVRRISIALGQMRAKQKIQSQEMLQLTEAGIPAWEFLAEKIGVDVPEAMEMVEKKKFRGEMFERGLQAILDGMDERFGGMMEKLSRSWGGLMSTMKDLGEITIRKIGEPMFALAKVRLTNLVDWMGSPEADKFIASTLPAVEQYAKRLIQMTENTVRFVVENRRMLLDLGRTIVTFGALRFIATTLSGPILEMIRWLRAIQGIGLAATFSRIMAVGMPLLGPAGLIAGATGLVALLGAAWVKAARDGITYRDALNEITASLLGMGKAFEIEKRIKKEEDDIRRNTEKREAFERELEDLNNPKKEEEKEKDNRTARQKTEDIAREKAARNHTDLANRIKDEIRLEQDAIDEIKRKRDKKLEAANKTDFMVRDYVVEGVKKEFDPDIGRRELALKRLQETLAETESHAAEVGTKAAQEAGKKFDSDLAIGAFAQKFASEGAASVASSLSSSLGSFSSLISKGILGQLSPSQAIPEGFSIPNMIQGMKGAQKGWNLPEFMEKQFNMGRFLEGFAPKAANAFKFAKGLLNKKTLGELNAQLDANLMGRVGVSDADLKRHSDKIALENIRDQAIAAAERAGDKTRAEALRRSFAEQDAEEQRFEKAGVQTFDFASYHDALQKALKPGKEEQALKLQEKIAKAGEESKELAKKTVGVLKNIWNSLTTPRAG